MLTMRVAPQPVGAAGYNLSCPTTWSAVLCVRSPAMLIGEIAAAVGVTVKAVRFYAEQGLLGSVPRAGAYRDFQSRHLQRLRVILHCRSHGFSVEEIREVIALLPDKGCPPPDAMLALVDAKLADLIEESKRLEKQMRRLVETRRYLAGRAETEVES